MLKPITLGTLSVFPPVFVAPMAGYTDVVFREILREHGAPFCYTEMVSAKGLIYAQQETEVLLHHPPSDSPLALQLFGEEPGDLARACEIVRVSGYIFDAIDINMGCPARKITSQGAGGALLRDPERAFDIVRAVRETSSLPVTVKTRLGWDNVLRAVEFCEGLQDAGANMIALHGRTVEQGYNGVADWDTIEEVAKTLTIPVVGNGDIHSVDRARDLLLTSNCAGIMVGRALLGNPFFFDQLYDVLQGLEPRKISASERVEAAIAHLYRSKMIYGERRTVLEMRKHLVFYVRGLRNASKIRAKLMTQDSIEGVIQVLKEESS